MKGWVPFSNGTEYMDWAEDNCFSCIKGYDEARGESLCALEPQLFADEGLPRWAERRIGTKMVRWTINGKSGSYKVLGDCRERVTRGDGDGATEGPAPDAPGQLFLWSDLWLDRSDADRAPVTEEVEV